MSSDSGVGGAVSPHWHKPPSSSSLSAACHGLAWVSELQPVKSTCN